MGRAASFPLIASEGIGHNHPISANKNSRSIPSPADKLHDQHVRFYYGRARQRQERVLPKVL